MFWGIGILGANVFMILKGQGTGGQGDVCYEISNGTVPLRFWEKAREKRQGVSEVSSYPVSDDYRLQCSVSLPDGTGK